MSSDNFRRIILAQMQILLKPHGFRKKGALFWAEQDDSVFFIQLQSSLKSTRDLLVATVNLGIFSRIIAASVGNTHAPNILEAQWRERIGRFIPPPSDKWWEIHSDDEANLCGAEISSNLEDKVLPKMRSLASAESLKSLWQTGESPGLTDYERKRYLQALAARSPNEP